MDGASSGINRGNSCWGKDNESFCRGLSNIFEECGLSCTCFPCQKNRPSGRFNISLSSFKNYILLHTSSLFYKLTQNDLKSGKNGRCGRISLEGNLTLFDIGAQK